MCTRTTYTSGRKTKRKTKNGDLVHRQIVSYRQSIVVFVHRHTLATTTNGTVINQTLCFWFCAQNYMVIASSTVGQPWRALLRVTAHLLRVICPIIIYLLMDLRSFLLWHQRKGKIIIVSRGRMTSTAIRVRAKSATYRDAIRMPKKEQNN